jgi:hypothetical protein
VWFTLDFCPDAELVVVVRRFVDDFCTRILNMDSRGLLAVAIHELLENGVKHSADGHVKVHIEVRKTDSGILVELETTNAASAEDRAALKKLVAARDEAGDVQKFYHAMMLKPGPGGLGLARIMAEAGMDLAFDIGDAKIRIAGTVEFPMEAVNGN